MNLAKYGVNVGSDGFSIEELLNREKLLEIVQLYANYLDTPSMAIGASLFIKRYAVITTAAALDYFGFQNGQSDWLRHAKFDRNSFTLTISEEVENIEYEWQKKLFYEHMLPIIQILSKECKISSRILWENVAVRMNTVLKMAEGHYPQEIIRLQYDKLCESHPAWLNGQKNPLVAYINIPNDEKQRKTCCRYYQLTKKEEGLPYCLVCPLKKDS